jgi:inner membrane transporter RhtA
MPQSLLFPVSLVLLSMVSSQTGASFAKMLIPQIGPAGATTMRLVLAAIMLTLVFRPWRYRLDARQRRLVTLYGVTIGAMNLLFYASLATVPLGVAVAIEFVGPLSVALVGARRAIDVFWIALAVLGLGLLLPLGQVTGGIDPVGAALALAAGACWAGYIVFGQRVGNAGGPHVTALGVAIAAAVALPFGIGTAGLNLFDPALLPFALAVALLSSALPYALDMVALPLMPRRLFSILMSGQPAIAALSGFIILSEALALWQLAGIAAIVIASLGATLTVKRRPV